MTTESYLAIAFYLFAALIIVGSLGVVLLPRIVHAALAMVFVFFLISAFYVLLGAEFIAATQIIVYVGAITVLFLFAIMLTNRSYAADSNPLNGQWLAAGGVGILTLVTLAATLTQSVIPVADPTQRSGPGDLTEQLGQLLMGPFLLPFEIAGILLLAAMIGAIVIAKES